MVTKTWRATRLNNAVLEDATAAILLDTQQGISNPPGWFTDSVLNFMERAPKGVSRVVSVHKARQTKALQV